MPSSACCHLRDLPSFPTRRSSDLDLQSGRRQQNELRPRPPSALLHDVDGRRRLTARCHLRRDRRLLLQHHQGSLPHPRLPRHRPARSEEHTSELQSQSNIVCRLLLAATSETYPLSLHDALPISIYSQGGVSKTNYGRDHHPRCFTMWMAGGGSRPGAIYGETDDFSYNIIKDPCHIHDFHATVLQDRKSTRLNSSHSQISYAVFCLLPPPRPTLFPYTTLFRSRFTVRAASAKRTTAATTIRAASRCGWPAAAHGPVPSTARPTTSPTTSSRIPATSTTSTPPSCKIGRAHV